MGLRLSSVSLGRTVPLALVLALACSRKDDCTRIGPNKSGATSASVVAAPPDAPVVTGAALPRGVAARTLTGRIQPHGKPTSFHFEYGETTAYGSATTARALPPRLAAHYQETFDAGRGGFRHGVESTPSDLVASGGASGGFVRHTEPSNRDANHVDGIGQLFLTHHYYPGGCGAPNPEDQPMWAAGDPDMRDARVRLKVRGGEVVPRGAELVTWVQVDLPPVTAEGDLGWRAMNWAFTGKSLTDALLTGRWENVEYTLSNDPALWSAAGYAREQGRPNYKEYLPLDETLAHMNCNVIYAFTLGDWTNPQSGTIDFDDYWVSYRNHSLLFPSNGGRLRSAPPGSTGADKLTDGWRNGEDRVFRSAPSPATPQEIVWDLARPVTVQRLQIHQDPAFPSKDVVVEASANGETFTTVAELTLPEKHPNGPNFAFSLVRDLDIPARAVRVRILNGYRAERWGLGEVEVFGVGAIWETDDDWYNVSTELSALQAGKTYHYRLVATSGAEVLYGPDRTFEAPKNDAPIVETLSPRRLEGGAATFEARITPMGRPTQVWFEYGAEATCAERTLAQYAGVGDTPRTFLSQVTGLVPGQKLYYRVAAENLSGLTRGEPVAFTVR